SQGSNATRDFDSATNTPVFHNVFGATVYDLSETGPSGYTAGSWSCDGGTQAGATISVPLGASVTCTINNTDDTPKLKLVKTVTNNDGGAAEPKDFTLSAVSQGSNATRDFDSATNTPVFHNVFGATIYDLSESGPSGYTAGSWSCDGGTQAGATISVPLGGSVTCTIDNTDDTPKLKLVKTVTNND